MKIPFKTMICGAGMVFASFMFAACGGDDGQEKEAPKTVEDQDEDDTKATLDDTYEYKLPVIFHVLYKDASDVSQHIPSARLQQLLSYVNMIYRGGMFGQSENVNVRFVAAAYDEKGNKLDTPGVEYVKWNGDYPISATAFMSDNSGKYVSYLWDPNEYINVMMYNFSSPSSGDLLLGISHMPYAVKGDDALAGLSVSSVKYIQKRNLSYPHCVSINSLYANANADGGYYESDRYADAAHNATYISPYDVVVTLAHELGHYLGLFHTFSEQTATTASTVSALAASDDCLDTDYCDDTPSYNRGEYQEYVEYYMQHTATPKLEDVLLRKPCEGEDFQSVNIMDYSYSLGYQITPQQKERLRWVMYYSPMIPGPKKNGANTRGTGGHAEGKLDLHPVMAEN